MGPTAGVLALGNHQQIFTLLFYYFLPLNPLCPYRRLPPPLTMRTTPPHIADDATPKAHSRKTVP